MKRYFVLFLAFLISLFKVNAQTLKVKLSEHTANVETIGYSPDGRYFASSGWDGAVNLYSLDSTGLPQFKYAFLGHLGAVTSLCFSANSKLIVSCGKDYSARIWNIDYPDSSKAFNVHFEPVTNAFLDPSGKTLITCSTDGTIKNTSIYDSKKSKTIVVGKAISDLVLTKDNKFYFASVKGGLVLKIETGTTKTIEEFIGHKDEVNTLDLSPDGAFLASGSSDKTIIIWDLATSKDVKKLTGFEWKVTCLEYSRDGNYVLGGCNDGAIKLFDARSGKMMTEFNEFSKNVRDVAFSTNENQIATATNLDGERYGALVYNSGVTYVKPDVVIKPKVSKQINKTPLKASAKKY